MIETSPFAIFLLLFSSYSHFIAALQFTDISATSFDYHNEPLQVDFDATSGNTQTIDAPVDIEDDEIYEEPEQFTVMLTTLSPNTGSECSTYGDITTATATITDNDCKTDNFSITWSKNILYRISY